MKITKLTESQKARFPECVEKWIKIGLSTEPADFDKAEGAVRAIYRLCGLGEPEIVLRMGSPMGCCVGGTLALVGLSVQSQVDENVREQVRQQVWQQLGQQVDQQVESQVWQQVSQHVGQQVEQQVRQAMGDSYYNLYNGQFWGSWGAYVSFLRDVCGWRDPVLERFALEEALITSCGYIWWHETVAVICDRPRFIKRDEQGRLHCETGHAIQYPDGWGLSSWHGTTVPDEWISDRSHLKPETILTWENVEQRRAGCEIIGWERILKELDAKEIDRHPDEEIGTLLQVVLPDAGPEKFIRVKCGTGRFFAVPVPPDVNTAMEAQHWMWGDKDYQPELRT